jgi:hypothetical protein
METNELKQIWKTLSEQKLISEELGKDNIERIIHQNSSNLMVRLTKKLKFDFIINVSGIFLLITVAVFLILIFKERYQQVQFQGFVFLLLTVSFFVYKVLTNKAHLNLIKLSHNTSTVLESLKNVKINFLKGYKKDAIISLIVIGSLTSFANVLLIDNTDLSKFEFNSFPSYVMIFSILYLIFLARINKFLFNKRFSSIISEIDNTIEELNIDKSNA